MSHQRYSKHFIKAVIMLLQAPALCKGISKHKHNNKTKIITIDIRRSSNKVQKIQQFARRNTVKSITEISMDPISLTITKYERGIKVISS